MAGGIFSQITGAISMLTILACKSAIKQAQQTNKRIKLFDGNGLFLDCRPNRSGYWRYKYRIGGKEKLLSFGGFPVISLEEARQKHKDARKDVTNGIDPSVQRQICPTFEQVGRDWFQHYLSSWGQSYATEIIRSLESGLFSLLGKTPIKEITRRTLLKALQTIEERKSSATAKRSLYYATRIFRFAAIREYVPYNIALDLKGALKPFKKGQQPSMPIDHLPTFLEKFDQCKDEFDQDAQDTIILLMLTLVRRSELLKAKWSEFNFDTAIWIIPAERMKMKREHLVPLSRQVMDILQRRKRENDQLNPAHRSEYVFASKNTPQSHIYIKVPAQVLQAMGYRNIHTPHGFRALGMGIAKEKLNYRHEVPDRQLAHLPANGVDRAYDRSLFLNERIEMMQRLADFIDQQ
jgi:integrase